MIKMTILNESMVEVTSLSLVDLVYPSEISSKLYIRNDGDNDLKGIQIGVTRGVSFQNFTAPPLIESVNVRDVFSRVSFDYAELLMTANDKVMDMFNTPGIETTIQRDSDGYVRNVFPNIQIKFHHTLAGGNSMLISSDAFYYSGVSRDVSGVAEGYQEQILFPSIDVGEIYPFWYTVVSVPDMESIKNPFKFNILIRGEEE